MKKSIIERVVKLESASNDNYIKKLVSLMTTEELKECIADSTPQERIDAILERVRNENKHIKKA